MRQWNDAELLTAYANRQSEEAFGVLVERYLALVYSAALRQVQNPQLAEEVAQAAFIILAQKARRLNERTVLSGWLCRTAHFVARNALKAELRRQSREQEAHMQSLTNEPEAEVWQQLAPLLDEAVAQLNDADRNAVVLRFYEKKPLNEVGAKLGIDPDAAQKRVSRALEKLRKFFSKHGVNSTTAIIAGTISANSIQAAPVGLAKTISAVAVVKEAIAAASTLTLVKGTMKTMTWLKFKFAIVVGMTVLLAGGTATIALSGNLLGSNSSQTITNAQQVLITTFFLKTPTAKVDEVIANFSKPNVTANQNSKVFQDLLKEYPDVEYFGAPRIGALSRVQATISITKPVQIDGTNSDVGIIMRVTPMVQPDSKISLKIQYELRELESGVSPAIKIIKQNVQPSPFKSGEMTILRNQISDGGQIIGSSESNGSETLLVFMKATIFKGRPQKIIQRAQ